MLLGYATGSVGDVTFARVKGNQVAKARNRNPSNPKSSGQVYQRAKFANAVEFYKRAVQNLFKFAYEDKGAQESDFNAFMRHNVGRAIPIGKGVVANSLYPAISNWITSVGSLNGPQAVIGQVGTLEEGTGASTGRVHAVGDYNISPSNAEGAAVPLSSQINAAVYSRFDNPSSEDVTTFGEFCAALKYTYPDLQEGDIVTVTLVHQIVQGIGTPGLLYPSAYDTEGIITAPSWNFAQFIIDSTSTVAIGNAVSSGLIYTSTGLSFIPALVSSDGIFGFRLSKTWQLIWDETEGGTFDPEVFQDMSSCTAAVITFSRQTSSGLRVSTQELSTSEGYQQLIELSQTTAFTESVLRSWDAADMAILEGGFIKA